MNNENITNGIPPVYLKDMNTEEQLKDFAGQVGVKLKMKFRLICASQCKKFAKEFAKANPVPQRAKMFTRVSQDFLMACESNLKEFIRNRVKNHPSIGKTLT